jgi:DNA ligase-1
VLLAELAALSRDLAATPARLGKVALLASALQRAAPDEIEPLVAFLSGSLRQGRIGLGPAALREAAGASHPVEPELGIGDVDRAFERIAALGGAGAASRRAGAIAALLSRATAEEAAYLRRLVLEDVRQGALAGLMEEAVAKAAQLPLAEIRRAVMLAGDVGGVARAALLEGARGLQRFRMELFRPIHPMLAQSAEGPAEALRRLGESALEWKLDGARVQVHRRDDEVRVFSRQLNDVTAALPEVVEAARELPARAFILDGEVIALRPDGTPHPFQVTLRRFGRRRDAALARAELPLTPYFFDLLRLDAEELLDAPLRERTAALAQLAPDLLVPQRITPDGAQAEAFLAEALARGHEGVMAKSLAAPYQAGGRNAAWLKVKPAHTLDLVVLAAEWGHGRRTGWLSNLHLGARDPAGGGFLMVGKTFKGLTDEMLAWQTARLQALAVATDGLVVHVRPELVVEVAFNNVQESPHYASEVALRFARVKRYRADKSPAQADTIDTLRDILAGRMPGPRR